MKKKRILISEENGREFYIAGSTAFVLDAKTKQRLAETEIPDMTDKEFGPWFRTRIKPRLINKIRSTEIDRNERLTFGDYWDDKKDEITDYYGWAGGTPAKYNNTIGNQLIPLLNHKPMRELTIVDYEEAIEQLKKLYKEKYSDSRMGQFKSNLSKIAEYAFRSGDCPNNPLQDEFFKCGGKDKNLEEIVRQRMTTRSLTSKQNSQVLYQISSDLCCYGQALGLGIMMFCGARDGEVLALNFGDVVNLSDKSSSSIWFYKTFDGDDVTDHMKTENAPRIVPVHSKLKKMIITKETLLKDKGYTEEQILKLPLVCKNEDYEERCDFQEFSYYAKETLLNSGVSCRVIILPYNIDAEIIKSERLTPTAYLLRRNFATYAKYSAGLDLEELKYLMGHVQAECEDLKLYRYFNTDDMQIAMRNKLELWQVVPCNHIKGLPEDEYSQPISTIRIVKIDNLQVEPCLASPAYMSEKEPDYTDNQPISTNEEKDSVIPSISKTSNEAKPETVHIENQLSSLSEPEADGNDCETEYLAEKKTHDNSCDDYYVFVTTGGKMRRTITDEYPLHKRKTSGVQGPDYKGKDFMKTGVHAKAGDMLLAYSSMGNVYAVPIDLIPCVERTQKAERETRNILCINADERIDLLTLDARDDASKDYLVIITKKGKTQRVSKSKINKLRPCRPNETAKGMQVMKLKEDDSIVSAFFTNGFENIIIGTKSGNGICFNENNVSVTSVNTNGMVAIKLANDDVCIGADRITAVDRYLLTISAKGRGKLTDLSAWSGEGKTQTRGGTGKEIQSINQNEDFVAALSVVSQLSEKVALLCHNGQLCRFCSEEIPVTGRSTAGVSLMKVKSDTEIKYIIMNREIAE